MVRAYSIKVRKLPKVPSQCLYITLYKSTHRGRRGDDRMVVWYTTICAISAYHN